MGLKYYISLVKTLFNFFILPVISLVRFLKNLNIVIYREFNRLNNIFKEINLQINFYIINDMQSIQIISKAPILHKAPIFCNSEFELSLKLEKKNLININSLFNRILPLKQFRLLI